ncbi:MAG: hypothetical protein IPK22_23095 [Verrucomicrobiaceae bacterium]|nr:hypothetical protein [Verrucomicrobiaceae bacterium]
MANTPPKGDGKFPTTEWTLVQRLKDSDAEVSTRALNELCGQYHYPLYCLIRARGLAHHDAQDALHDFLAKLLRLGSLQGIEQEKGRLRTFLAKALERALITRYHRESRREQHEVPLNDPQLPFDPDLEDRYASEATSGLPPDKLFDRKWCEQLLGRVLRQLAEDYTRRGKQPLFEILRPVLLAGGSLRGHDATRLAESLTISEPALRTALVRLLRDYRHLLEHEVRQTVESKEAVEAEIADLMASLST